MIVATCGDSSEVALVRALLSAHEIDFHISGDNHAAMMGAGPSAVRQVVWVPTEQAEQARALIDEMREGGEAALADDEIPEDDVAERDDSFVASGALVTTGEDTLGRLGKRTRVILAIMIGATLGHGLAHMSTRAWKRGIVLAGAQVGGWWTMASGNLKLGAVLVLATMGMDVVGAIMEIVQTPSNLPPARVVKSG